MGFYEKTEQFMVSTFTAAGNHNDISHHQRTVYWIKQLKPDADEALLIAGITHDIERAFYGDWKKGSDDPGLLRKHQNLSAGEVEVFLKDSGADNDLIQRVVFLIKHHEKGVDGDSNILCDADCIAYFEEKALRHAKNYRSLGNSKKEMKKKFDYVFSRIFSLKAKQIAKTWYNQALNELKK